MILYRQNKSKALSEQILERRLSSDRSKVTGIREQITLVLMRPVRMFAEPIVLLTDLFLLYQYAILFLYFEAYPLILKGR